MITLKEFKKNQMKNVEFVKEYKDIQPEMDLIRAMIEAREYSHMTQSELAKKTGIAQTEISKIENGSRNPSIKLLQRLADGMGMKLRISFVPQS